MARKTYEVKESGFVSVFVNGRTKNEAIKNYKMKHGWYGGSLNVKQHDKKLKLYPRKNKFPAINLMKLHSKRRKTK